MNTSQTKSEGFNMAPNAITISEDDVEPTQIMRRCISMPACMWDVRSIMKFRTLDESLHSKYSDVKGERGLTFDKVIVREYARTVGDNPSCSSGPPMSIAWEYNVLSDVTLDEFENTRPPRRTHFEMVLPRKIRHDMLRREWDVTQKQIAESVRRNVKAKNYRKATVNNLGKATRLEEFMESSGRKFKRLITFKKPVSTQVKQLEAKMNEAQRRRSQRALEMQMLAEYGSVNGNSPPDAIDTSTSST